MMDYMVDWTLSCSRSDNDVLRLLREEMFPGVCFTRPRSACFFAHVTFDIDYSGGGLLISDPKVAALQELNDS
jgi:hypothetical protein